ncbi:MAG: NAD(P)/FAD-dependent oxidoreductase [Eubacteriales bacterium]
MKYDSIILGAGPAGMAAALALRGRNKSVLMIGNHWSANPLAKAPEVDNYLGMPKRTGAQMMEEFSNHCEGSGVERVEGRVVSAMIYDGFALTIGSDLYQGETLILAQGVARQKKYQGEEDLLGKGVSYCATCDGMLYRGKKVVVMGTSKEVSTDAQFLHGLGCETLVVSMKKPSDLPESIPFRKGSKFEVVGESVVEGISVDGEVIPCQGLFILRDAVAPTDLFPTLEVSEGSIVVSRQMETNIEGIYAAGDCTGAPLQVAKAVGEGHVAGLAAAHRLEQKKMTK